MWRSRKYTVILAIGISLLFCTSSGITAQKAPLGSFHDSLDSRPNIGHDSLISPAAIPSNDPWSYSEYTSAIEGIFGTFDYFNLTKYGGGWQYEVTRDWTDRAFTYGKYIIQDAECIVGLLSAYNLTKDAKYLRYAEAIWNWDQHSFFDNVYGGYYIRLNQDNSIAIGDKSMFDQGWYALATAQLYAITRNSTYLNEISYIYTFITDNFYDPADGSYYGSLNRDLSILVSAVDTNWCAAYVRFLLTAYVATDNNTYRNKAIELVDNIINHAYDSQYGWIVNRVTSDWSSFSNSAKGWYDVLQTFIDAYRVLGDAQYLTFAQTCFNDIQQANSSAGYLMEMNRDWTSVVNNQILGEEDPGVAIAYLRIAQELDNASILKEAYRYKEAIYNGLHDPVYGGIYRRIDASGAQDRWKQWCGAGRVIEMLAVFAPYADIINSSNDECSVINSMPVPVYWGGVSWTPQGLYAFGGEGQSGRLSVIMHYNPTSDSAEIMSAGFSSGISRATAQRVGDYIYIFGGYDGAYLDTVYRYDFKSDTLTELSTKLPVPMSEIGSATNGTHIFLVGGFGSSPERKSTIYVFNPQTEEIVSMGNLLPEGLSQTTPVWGHNALYILGGQRYGGSAHSYILAYDPALNTCSQITTALPQSISGMSGCWDGSDTIFIFGGELDGYSGSTRFDTIYKFNVQSRQLEVSTAKLPAASSFHLTAWGNSAAYLIGGLSQTWSAMDSIVKFTPASFLPLWPELRIIQSPANPVQDEAVQVEMMTNSTTGINQSILSYSVSGYPFSNQTMSNSSGFFLGQIPGMPAYAEVTYRVYAQDGNHDWSVSENYSYSVRDTAGPAIELSRYPQAPVNTAPVSINATIIDPSGVDHAALSYSSDNQTTWTEVQMSEIGNYWIGEIPALVGGTNVSYYVSAQDCLGNWGNSEVDSYAVDDVQGPAMIISRSPVYPSYTDVVWIKAEVFDTSMVAAVILSYRIDEGSWQNQSMRSLSYLYQSTIPNLPIGSAVEYKVYARDYASNWAVSNVFSYVVRDGASPIISATNEPTRPCQLDSVNITAEITDASGVAQVILSYAANGGGWINSTMIILGSLLYSAQIPAQKERSEVFYKVYALDSTGNWACSSVYNYSVLDAAPPQVSITRSPATPDQDDTVEVTASVSDASDISQVILSVSIDGASWMNCSMGMSNGHWTSTVQCHNASTTVEYMVFAVDVCNNWMKSSVFSYSVLDTASPIVGTSFSPSERISSDTVVSASAHVTDASSIAEVTLFYTTDDWLTMSEVAAEFQGTYYEAAIPSQEIDTIVEFYFNATDAFGNIGSSITREYHVGDFSGPDIAMTHVARTASVGTAVEIEAEVMDASNVATAILAYSNSGGTTWTNITMAAGHGNWSATIPAMINETTVFYRVLAVDGKGNWATTDIMSYRVVTNGLGIVPIVLVVGGSSVAAIAIILYLKRKGVD